MSPHIEIWNSPHIACVWCRKRRHICKIYAIFTRFHVETNWARKYICGEKMTNMRSVLPYSEKMRKVPRQVWVESSNIIKTFLESKPFEQYFFINIKLPTSWFAPYFEKYTLYFSAPPRKKVLPRASLDTLCFFENDKELHKEGWVQNQGWKRILDPGSPICLNFLSPNAKNRSQMLFSFLH